MKIHPEAVELFNADRDIHNQLDSSSNCVNAPKKLNWMWLQLCKIMTYICQNYCGMPM